MTEKNWLDEMWYSGYCYDAVRMAARTALDKDGARARVEWMSTHVPGCEECWFANFFKAIEAEVASELGMLDQFVKGGDVAEHPGHGEIVERKMKAMIAAGLISEAIVEWMDRVVKRRDAPWPGRVEDEDPA